VIASEDADELRGIDEELEHTKQNFQPEPLIVRGHQGIGSERWFPVPKLPRRLASAASSASRSPYKSP
jgi:hypothetical protein